MRDLWDDERAARLDPLGRLVYRSNLLGSDLRITNSGGGNTSAKLAQRDPVTGETVEVLWVKGSGGDLRTATKDAFASLDLRRVLGLRRAYANAAERGPKTPAEDRMVGLYAHCTSGGNPRASSIDTPLHAFVPARHIDHTHPNACIALAAARRSEELTRAVYGDEVAWTPWQRPGFDLGLVLQELHAARPHVKGVILGGHGLINWADDDRECYRLTLELIERAASFIDAHDKGEATFGGQLHRPLPEPRRDAILAGILPWLRGRLSMAGGVIATVQTEERIQRFVNSKDAPRLAELGTSCPDHFLRTKIKPLYVSWDPQREGEGALREKLAAGIAQYREDYRAYYEAHRRADSPPMRDPNPTVILVPGLGMIAWGKSKSESRATAEFYGCAVEVMRGAEAIDAYTALPPREAFDIEYWQLEEAKVRRMPAEAELSRRVVAVLAAGSEIGAAVARRAALEGAQVVCVDEDREAAESTAAGISSAVGAGLGVAGSGVSACGPAVAIACDAAKSESVRRMLAEATLAYGGVDSIVICPSGKGAGDARSDPAAAERFSEPPAAARAVAEEATGLWHEQGLPAALVVVAGTPEASSCEAGAAAVSAVAELAADLAPWVRVNGVVPAAPLDSAALAEACALLLGRRLGVASGHVIPLAGAEAVSRG